ncbi:MAG: replicative DNA helicase [Gammaproteobacteria bacterium]|nr:replicative DNA helicase [Gammaproteobacteria bacterium]
MNPKAGSADAQTAAVKIPPHSIDAEQSVLGGLMLDNNAWDQIADRIAEQDFYRADHRAIFQVMSELSRREQPFDVLTVTEALKNINALDTVGGDVYLFELAKNIPTVANIVAYSDIVRERSILRQLIGISNEVAGFAFNPEGRPSREILDEAESKIFKIAEQQSRGDGPVDISSLLKIANEKIDILYHSGGAITGLATGFADLDNMTSGFQDGDLVIVAGRPSMGKTSFAINIAEHAAIKGDKPILVFSMEMPGDSLAMRMLSSLGHIDQHKVRTGKLQDDDWPRLTSAVSMLSEAKMFIDDTPALSPSEMRARARRLARKHGQLGLIVIDYLQLMSIPGTKENRTNEITEISRSLKGLAKELRTPVVALSQLNRSLEQRTDKRPIMSDLRDSGSIEQDADVILFIYRDEVYNEDTPDKGKAEIIIAKQRNGPIGKLSLTFLGQYTKFENYTSSVYAPESF